ncbi:uncharacterized protein LOC141641737 [Silene latifolia]|uniref:uncharacterized protein LOC141641737 n=1 Tax=Silene latifolia TaxID=37657 RepID=UPI003D780E2B
MDEQIKGLQSQLAAQSQHTQKLETQISQMMLMMQGIQTTLQERPPPSTERHPHSEVSTPRPLGYTPKLEFPVFDGSNSSMWIKKCARYFSLCRIHDDLKVDLAALNMVGKAETWVISYLAINKGVVWDEFIVDLMARFRDEMNHNVVEKFNRLQQVGTVEKYVDEFEALKGLLLQKNPRLPPDYFLDCFVGGLKPTLKSFVKAFKPQTIAEAIEYARLQEDTISATARFSGFQKPYQNSTLSNAESHTQKTTVSGEVNALSGSQGFHTMRVVGTHRQKPLHILVDSGSTHNFMDLSLAKKLGCSLEKIPPQAVAVADGNHLACQYVCKKFSWMLHGHTFTNDVMLIPLGNCDMVLGIQWLNTLGPVKWDFKRLVMEFQWQDVWVKLQGIPAHQIKVQKGEISQEVAVTQASQLYFLQLVTPDTGESMELCSMTVSSTQQPQPGQSRAGLQELLDKYKGGFKEPKSLPPSRGVFDHRIPLISGASPVSIRPYRYPLKQRDVIEKLVGEMLDNGIIQNSSSPFASPVVLVGKKDGSWRLCIDYRELNKRTLKDKFPIPVVDELIDDVDKLRMSKYDVYKTAFKTHEGHYEFLVMPFGLTNASASFQGWMNSVFKRLLRK